MNIVVSDEDSNSSSVKQIVKSSNRGKTVVSAADVTFDDGVKFGTSGVNAKTKNYDPKTGKLTLTGKVNRPATTLRIGNQDVRVKSDGTFKLVLDLGNHGSKVFPVLIGDTTIGDTVQERLIFYVDANTPEVTLNHEKDEQGHYTPIYTNNDKAASSTSLENAKAILKNAKGILTQTGHQVVLPKVEQPVNVSTTEKKNENNTKKVSEVSKDESPNKQVEPVEKQNETASTQNKDNVVGTNQQTSIKNSKESSNQNDTANAQTPIKNNAIHEKTSSSVSVKPHTHSQNNKQVAPKTSSSKPNNRNNKELPKTGEKETLVSLIVTGVTILLASVGIVIKRRNKN